MKKVRGAVIAAAVAASVMVVPGMPVALAAENGSLLWGIRASFNNYVGGPVLVGDGATEDKSTGAQRFSFPLENANYDRDEVRLEAQFKGTVKYKQYCDGNEDKLNARCDLDLTFSNPKVVLDDDKDSYIEATVNSRQYLSGTYYDGDGQPVRVVNLYPQSGTFRNVDGTINWSEIPATLTEQGNMMMSEFYDVGEGMDPVDFSYQGDGADITDPNALRAYPMSWDSPVPYDSAVTRIFDLGKNVLASAGGRGIYLLSEDLRQLAAFETNASKRGTGAYDAKTSTFYYAEEGSKELKALPVTDDGFGEARTVYEANGEILAVGAHPKTGKVVAIAQDAKVGGQADALAQLITVSGGQAQGQELPTSERLYKPVSKQLTAVEQGLHAYSESAYRSSFDPNNIRELMPMDDGTFVYASRAEITFADGGSSYKNMLISIDPAAEGAEVAKAMPGSYTLTNKQLDAVTTNGSRIIRANTFGDIQSLVYAERDIKEQTPVSFMEGYKGWGLGGFEADGTPVVINGQTGKLVWFDPETFTVKREAAVPNGREVSNLSHGDLIIRADGLYYTPTVDESRGDYIEHYSLRMLHKGDYTPSTPSRPRPPKPGETEQPEGPKKPEGSTLPGKTIGAIIGGLVGGLAVLGALFHFFGGPLLKRLGLL